MLLLRFHPLHCLLHIPSAHIIVRVILIRGSTPHFPCLHGTVRITHHVAFARMPLRSCCDHADDDDQYEWRGLFKKLAFSANAAAPQLASCGKKGSLHTTTLSSHPSSLGSPFPYYQHGNQHTNTSHCDADVKKLHAARFRTCPAWQRQSVQMCTWRWSWWIDRMIEDEECAVFLFSACVRVPFRNCEEPGSIIISHG